MPIFVSFLQYKFIELKADSSHGETNYSKNKKIFTNMKLDSRIQCEEINEKAIEYKDNDMDRDAGRRCHRVSVLFCGGIGAGHGTGPAFIQENGWTESCADGVADHVARRK